MRILFSSEYLDSDCDPSLYVEDHAFDDTIGTWLTNYAIFAACFFFAIKFASCPPYKRKTNIELIRNHSEEENPNSAQDYDLKGEEDKGTKRDVNHYLYNVYLVLFFVGQGLTFGIAGLGHQFIHSKSSKARDPVNITNYVLATLTNVVFFLIIFELTGIHPTKGSHQHKLIWYGIMVIMVLVIILSVIYKTLMVPGSAAFITYLIAIILLGITAKRDRKNIFHYIIKIVGIILLIAGFVAFGSLFFSCGYQEYENCFEQCPLPYYFNQNALFHVIYLAGLIILGWSEDRAPTSLLLTQLVDEEFEA